MYFKLKYRVAGAHVWARVFAGPDKDHLGCNGDLCFTKEEWAVFFRCSEKAKLWDATEEYDVISAEAKHALEDTHDDVL